MQTFPVTFLPLRLNLKIPLPRPWITPSTSIQFKFIQAHSGIRSEVKQSYIKFTSSSRGQ